MLNPSRGVLCFTDGSAWPNDRTGGWAWLAVDGDDTEVTGFGSVLDTTISQMELQAAYECLNAVFDMCGPCDILLYSDSEYVVKGNNDRTRARRTNNDYWDRLDAAVEQHELVIMEHVRGHSESYYNDVVDKLAGEARRDNYVDREKRILP